MSIWEKERCNFFEGRGLKVTVLEEEERRRYWKAVKKEKRLQKEERIRKLFFNK